MRPLVGQSGYHDADFDMNLQIQTTDINILLFSNIGRGKQYSRQVELNLYAKRKK